MASNASQLAFDFSGHAREKSGDYPTSFAEDIKNFNAFGKETIVTSTEAEQVAGDSGCSRIRVETYVNEFWTSKQRAAERERRLVVPPDSEGETRPGCDADAVDVWNRTASRLHFTLDFRINSQSLTACLTPAKAIGGTAWPNFLPKRDEWILPLVLWANTTLGLLSFWWIGSRQQQGRARLTISQLPRLTVLDPRALSPAQLARAEAIFERFKAAAFLPANEAYRDAARQALDRAVLIDLLHLPESTLEPLALLRDQWCAEPSVHGGKSTRISTQMGMPIQKEERQMWRERILGRYLQNEISRAEAIEAVGVNWVELSERQHEAMMEDIAWAMGR